MPFFTQCPYCQHGVRAPDKAFAGSVKCPACGSWYTAIPKDEPKRTQSPSPANLPRPGPRASASAAEGETRPASAGAAVQTPPAPVLTSAPPPAPTQAAPVLLEHFETPAHEPEEEAVEVRHPPLLGVAACLLAGAGLLAAAFQSTTMFTRPLAGLGLLLGVAGGFVVGSNRPARLALPVGGAVVSGLVLLVALLLPSLLGPLYEASRQKSDYDPEAVRVVPLQLTGGAEGLEVDGFADASRAAIQQGGIRVRVAGATIEPVRISGAQNRNTKQTLLVIRVQVQHLGHGPTVPFSHWALPGVREVPPASATAGGRKLGIPNRAVELPIGGPHGVELSPGRTVSDLLVFEPPGASESVRLELPAEAWGGRGAFRFLIPSSMITTKPGKRPR